MNDPTATTARIVDALEQLCSLADEGGMTTIVSELRDERLPAIREGRMSMVVLGEFNHGKSSLVNALLGEEALPTGITPTTSAITLVRRGTGPARAVRDDGPTELSREALEALVTQEAPADVRHVEVFSESDFLIDGLTVVDTPGVNDISKQKVEITYGYVPRADVVVYVMDATQALKRSELNFIEDRLIRGGQERLFFVLGKVDSLSAEEVREVIAHVEARLGELLGAVRIWPLSARLGAKGEDPRFDEFRRALIGFLERRRDEIVVTGGVRTGLRLSALADQSLAIEQGALALADDELARRVEAVRERLARSRSLVSENVALIERRAGEIAAVAHDNVLRFTEDFAGALPHEVAKADPSDLRRYLPDFIHDNFRNFIETEGIQTAAQLDALAEEVISITNRDLNQTMEAVTSELGARTRGLDLEVDTFRYDVGVFAVGALGLTFLAFSNLLVGGLLTLAAPVLAFVLKDRVEQKLRDKALEQGIAAIRGAGQKVDEEMARQIREFAVRLQQFVEDAGDRIHRQVMDVLDRVVAERKNHADDREAFARHIGEMRVRVTAIRADFDGLRAELGSAPSDGATVA